MPPIYFTLGHVQPFADMSMETVEEGVALVRGDGKVVGLRLEDPRTVVRLPELIERLGLDEERVWNRLRGDVDVVAGSRAATWGGGGA
ncbi:MAG TPA: hypothetical protein VM844_06210 [Miltoncostaeaceae bacterium]|jgi:hypothetical protein|nr:hypothetical protein [Miltoncostaeaceae bacterium]